MLTNLESRSNVLDLKCILLNPYLNTEINKFYANRFKLNYWDSSKNLADKLFLGYTFFTSYEHALSDITITNECNIFVASAPLECSTYTLLYFSQVLNIFYVWLGTTVYHKRYSASNVSNEEFVLRESWAGTLFESSSCL